jgi:hypothetical protein
MPSVTKVRTISAVIDERVVLQNSNYARKWTALLGTTWTKIRIACRATIVDSGANAGSTPIFAIGICSGTTQIFQDATCHHWLGVVSQLTTWTRNAGPPVFYVPGGASYYNAGKKVASGALSGLNVITNFASTLFDSTTANRSVFCIDITKGSPNFTITTAAARNNNTPGDIDLPTYQAQIETASPSFANHTNYAGVTVAIDEVANGYFDSVAFAWDHTTPAIELSDITIVRLA